MKASTLTSLAALAVFGIGGFFAGRISAPAPEGAAAATDGSAETRGVSRSSGRPGGSAASPERARRDRDGATGLQSPAERNVRLEEIVRGEDPLQRNRALLQLIDQLNPDEFEGAVAYFRSLGITERRFGEYALLLSAWAKVDPLAALSYTTENTRGGFATNTILSTWATDDAEGAIRWAEANHEGDDANPYMAGIIRGLAGSDPNRATQLLTAMPRSGERGEALDAMLPHLLTQGPDSARAWISGLDDESLRNGAILRSAEPLAAADPKGTMQWLLENPGEASRRRMDDVFSVWAYNDRDAAMAAMSSMAPGDDRSNALRGVVSSLAPSDPQQALDLMNRYSGDVNDRVVQNFIWHSFGNDPSTAVAQISRISNEREREQMYRRTLDRWLERDEDAAATWIESNPDVPAQVIEHLNRRRR
ncbi:MAG: hypothetical protein H7A49_06920 [Akkermansiaceae bacterium]|nr:hypothetical protein [Akkermansiaceae bacterium]